MTKANRGEIKLVKPDLTHEKEVMAYKKDFKDRRDNMAGSSYLGDYDDYKKWLTFVYDNEDERTAHTEVTASVYLAINEEKRVVGMFNIRHDLNDYLYHYGGHIGYSVRLGERRKGYAKEMMRQGLEKCKLLGLEQVLLVCDAVNVGSVRTIKAFGGQLENEVMHEGELIQRYWINLTNE